MGISYRTAVLWILVSIVLMGCPFDGDSGSTGAQGATGDSGLTGAQGLTGADGISGISCWDLNENGTKDSPSEDTNLDGAINVLDCRAQPSVPVSQTIVNTSTPGKTAVMVTHPSLHFETGSFVDLANRIRMEDPIVDGCGLWSWKLEGSGLWSLRAKNAIPYDSEHYPEIIPLTPGPGTLGRDQCIAACKSAGECVGTFFAGVAGRGQTHINAIECVLLMDPGVVMPEAAAFMALQTLDKVFVSEQFHSAFWSIGLVSVCDAP